MNKYNFLDSNKELWYMGEAQEVTVPISSIVHSLEGGVPSELLWTIHILSMQLYKFSYRFAQNWSFFQTFFLIPEILTWNFI